MNHTFVWTQQLHMHFSGKLVLPIAHSIDSTNYLLEPADNFAVASRMRSVAAVVKLAEGANTNI